MDEPTRDESTEPEARIVTTSSGAIPNDLGIGIPAASSPQRWLLVLASAAALLAIAGLAIAIGVSQRYSITSEANQVIILDNWRGEVLSFDRDFTYAIPINRRDQKTLLEGRLWGEFGDIPIDVRVYYANGVLYYSFKVNQYTEVIERAVADRKTITFDLQSPNNVTLHSIRENFGDVIHIVSDVDGERESVGVSFDGSVRIDAVTWRGIAKLNTRM